MSTNPNPGFPLESWCLYGVGVVCVVLRLFSRIRKAGIGYLQVDDYFVVFGLLWYTVLCVAFNEMLKGAGSNLMTPEEEAELTPGIVAQRVEGSKWVFVTEHAMLLTIWSMKAAMLVLYLRVTEGLRQRKILNGVIVWVICSFVGDELALFTICRPLSQYWAVPVSDPQCSSYQYYQIINAIFNISTDVMLLAVGLPPVLKARLSLQQKLILGVVFGMGSFVIVAAILRAIYCLVPSLISYVYMNWYFREASVAIYVTNAPAIWVLLREVFPKLQRLGASSRNRSRPTGESGMIVMNPTQSRASHWKDMMKLSGRGAVTEKDDLDLDEYPINSKSAQVTTNATKMDSGERRAGSQDNASVSSHGLSGLEIRRDVTVTVERVSAKESV